MLWNKAAFVKGAFISQVYPCQLATATTSAFAPQQILHLYSSSYAADSCQRFGAQRHGIIMLITYITVIVTLGTIALRACAQ